MYLKENKDAIEFCLEDSLFKEHCLKDYLGKKGTDKMTEDNKGLNYIIKKYH